MSHDLETRFHTEWLGLVQPVEGLVVSVPVLAEAQCMRRQPLDAHQRFVACTTSPDDGAAPRRLDDLTRFLADILDWTPELYDTRDALPDDLALYVPEGHQTLRPTLALRHRTAPETPAHSPAADDSTPRLPRRGRLCRPPLGPAARAAPRQARDHHRAVGVSARGQV